MNNDNMTAKPVSDKEYHLYVTIESARKAADELAALVSRKWRDEIANYRKQLVTEIVDTYVPYAKPAEEEKKKLHLTDTLNLRYGEGAMAKFYDLYMQNCHESVKPVKDYINISLTHWLALNEADRKSTEIKEREYRLSEDFFREIVYMKEKDCIEQMLPEAMPFLQFEPFVYNTQFLSESAKEAMETN